ncbi:MAG: hypothetical protein AAF629_18490 [Chloroflexota bacterium]
MKSIEGEYAGCQLTLNQTHYQSIRIELQQALNSVATHDVEAFIKTPYQIQKFENYLTNGIKVSPKGTLLIKEFADNVYCQYEQFHLEQDFEYLEKLLDFLTHLMKVYTKISALGGQVIPILKLIINNHQHPLRSIALPLLRNVEHKSREHFRAGALCSSCLLRWALYEDEVQGSLGPASVRYYGCRKCQQTINPLFGKKVIAEFDDRFREKWRIHDHSLSINWPFYRMMFDFDEVAIVRTTDEAV